MRQSLPYTSANGSITFLKAADDDGDNTRGDNGDGGPWPLVLHKRVCPIDPEGANETAYCTDLGTLHGHCGPDQAD